MLKTDPFFTNRYSTINPQTSFVGVVVALQLLQQLQSATKLNINTLTTDKILSVTKFCQWFFGFSAIGFFVGGMEFILLPIVDVLIDNLRD